MMNALIKVIGVGAVVALLAGCGANRSETPAESDLIDANGDCVRPLVIGMTAPISGSLAGVGQLATHGFEVGVEKITRDGILGCEIETVVLDDQGDPATSLSAVKSLVQQSHIDVYIGGSISSASLATSEFLNQSKVVSMLALPSAADLFNPDTYPYNFGTGPQSDAYGAAIGQAILDAGHDQVTIVTENLAAGKAASDAVADTLKDAGVEPLATIEFPADGANLDAYAVQVKDSGAEAVLLCSQAPQLTRLLESLAKVGSTAQVFGCAGMATPQFRELNPAAPVGSVTAYFGPAFWRTDVPNVKEYFNFFTERWGAQPTASSEGQVYNALVMWAAAVREAGTAQSDAVVEALKSLEGVLGADAPMTYGPDKRSPYTAESFVPTYLVKADPKLHCTTPINDLVFCDAETLEAAGFDIP